MSLRAKQSDHSEKKTVSGILQITRKGVGYMPWPDHEDIEVAPEDLCGALNGDAVAIKIQKLFPRPRGVVAKVEHRAKREFVSTIKHIKEQWVGIADDSRFYRPFRLKTVPKSIVHGSKALIELVHFDGSEDPQGKILEVLGPAGEHGVEMHAIVLEHGFRTEFPLSVQEEAQTIEREHANMIGSESLHRSDFREVTTFTIDPKDAKDFDDALSLRKLPDGNFEVSVHIADVTFFVRPGSALEEEAKKRGTSVYLVDRTIPMLPHELSGNVCSLREGEDRLAFAAIFTLNEQGDVLSRRFERTIIRSNKRFTYEEAQEILNTIDSKPEAKSVAEPVDVRDFASGLAYGQELIVLRDLARKLRARRAKEGAIDFGDNEVRFELDEKGVPIRVVRKERIETNLLIEEFMLLANREVAQFVSHAAEKVPEKGLVFLYRIHDEPKADRIEDLSTFVRAIGFEFKKSKKGRYGARDIAHLLKQIEGTPEEHLIRTATLRSMAKAIYSTQNIGHFGLAFEYYTHFTSPIRRYPDMLVHRLLASHLAGTPVSRREFDTLERLCINASEQEAKAVDAERDSIRYKQVEYMHGKIGQTFDAVISGVTDWGLYVEDKESACEGLVKVRSIGGDFYEARPKEYALVGQRTKKKFTLGDVVKVKLTGADMTLRTLDFELV